MQALETNYTDSIRTLKEKNDKMIKQARSVRAEKVNEVSEKSELEQLFIDCIEEVRKEVMRRRFRNEVANRKAQRLSLRSSTTATLRSSVDQQNVVSDKEALEFEQSLHKLSLLSRQRVKSEDFTARDRFIILDLFVNNEKTLLKIYEALFPPRATGVNANTQ